MFSRNPNPASKGTVVQTEFLISYLVTNLATEDPDVETLGNKYSTPDMKFKISTAVEALAGCEEVKSVWDLCEDINLIKTFQFDSQKILQSHPKHNIKSEQMRAFEALCALDKAIWITPKGKILPELHQELKFWHERIDFSRRQVRKANEPANRISSSSRTSLTWRLFGKSNKIPHGLGSESSSTYSAKSIQLDDKYIKKRFW